MSKINFRLRDMDNYCKEKGIQPIELTLEEQKMFIIEEKNEYTYFPLSKKGECEVCGNKTHCLSHGYEVYLCGQDCFDYFESVTEEGNGMLVELRRERNRRWHKISVEELLKLGYDAKEMEKRIDCSLEDIQEIIEKIKQEKKE